MTTKLLSGQVNTNNDWFYSSTEFQAFFKQSKRSVIIKANAPHFTIVAVSDNYLRMTHREREDILGKDFFDIFPGNAVAAVQQDSLLQSFNRVIKGKTTDVLSVYEYQIFLPDKSEFSTQYWSNINEPAFDDAGDVSYIIRTVTNVTDQVLAEHIAEEKEKLKASLAREQVLNEELASSVEELRSLNEELHNSQKNLFTLTSELEARVSLRTLQLTEKEEYLRLALAAANLGSWTIDIETGELTLSDSYRNMMGLPLEGKIHREQVFERMEPDYRVIMSGVLKRALEKGEDINNVFSIIHGTTGEKKWIKGVGKIFYNTEGKAVSVIGVNSDITLERVASETLQKLNEDLATMNEELSATNEEQTVINEELQQAQTDYIEVYTQLLKNQEDLVFTIDAATIATWDLNPATGRFTGNDLLKSWFGLLPEEEIELQNATNMIAEGDRERVIGAIEKALQFDSGGNYDIEYAILNPLTHLSRTVKAKGRTRFDDNHQPLRLSGILQDITEQRRDDQRKNDFIGMVSHEMKTPLTSLSGYLQLLQSKANNDNFATSMLAKADKQISKITTLINGFLNVSRLESGKIHIDKQRFDLALLMKEAEEEVIATINSHTIVFHPVEITWVDADRDKIAQVIHNLISNAVKYSSAHTVINVACVTINDCATVSVTDEGIGIKQKDIPKLFDRYYRVNEGSQIASGFGIGLYLCAEIIQRHEGKIWVDSEVGKGSTFSFSLPVVQTAV